MSGYEIQKQDISFHCLWQIVRGEVLFFHDEAVLRDEATCAALPGLAAAHLGGPPQEARVDVQQRLLFHRQALGRTHAHKRNKTET